MAPRKTPGGGPKPDKLMRDALALELHQEVKLTTGEKVKKLRLVARTLVDNAIDGDTTAARECFDRMDGKVTQGWMRLKRAATSRSPGCGQRIDVLKC